MSALQQLLQGAGQRPYRELVQHHLRKQKLDQIKAGLIGTVALLPRQMQDHAVDLIDAANHHLATNRIFWRNATVEYAFDYLMGGVAPFALPVDNPANFHLRVIRGEDAELAFNIFQIVTLSFAAWAAQVPAQRKFMGIKKGWFS